MVGKKELAAENSLNDMANLPVMFSQLIGQGVEQLDRKSTRLNSSHLGISYAVFCLKKNKALHVLEPARAGPLDEFAHQPAGQASPLPAVRDGHGNLAALTVRQDVVSRAGSGVGAARRGTLYRVSVFCRVL